MTALRKKYGAAKTSAAAQAGKAAGDSASALAAFIAIPKNLPDDFIAVVEAVRLSVVADFAKILNSSLTARALFAKDGDDQTPPFFGRYFWVEDMASEMEHHDRSISKAWEKATAGNSDEGSLLTLFLCVAAGAAPKMLPTKKTAASLIRRIQKTGFNPDLSRQYILSNAPRSIRTTMSSCGLTLLTRHSTHCKAIRFTHWKTRWLCCGVSAM